MASVDRTETAKLWDVASGRLLRSFYAGLQLHLSRVALSPDGRLLVASADGGSIVIWDTGDGREVVLEPGQGGEIHWILWSPDSRLIVIAGHDQRGNDGTFRISVFDRDKAEDLADSGFLRDFKASAIGETTGQFLNDGRSIAFARADGDNTVTVWDVTTGTELRSFRAADKQMTVSREGVIAVVNYQSVDLFSATGVRLRGTQPHGDFIASAFFSPDGRMLYGLDYKGTLVSWDVASGRKISAITAPAGSPPLRDIKALLPDGQQFVQAVGPNIFVRDLKIGAVVRTIGEKVDRVFSLLPQSDPPRVLVGGVGTLADWHIGAGRLLRKLEVGEGGLNTVQATADGKTLLLGYTQRLIRLIDAGSGRELARITGTARPLTPEQQRDDIGRAVWGMQANVDSMSFAFTLSRDGALLAHGRNDGLTRIFTTAGGPKLAGTIERAHGETAIDPRRGDPITALALSPSGDLLASGGTDSKAKLWDPKTARLVRELAGHTWSVMSMAWLPHGKQLLTGSGDRTIIQWAVDTGKVVRKIQAHDGVVKALSTDGKLAVSGGSEGVVKVWDLATGKPKHILRGHVGEVTAVGLSPDGQRVLSGGDDATLKVWDAGTGALLASFIVAANGEWLVMTPDGFFAASKAGASILSIVRGHDITTIDQVHQSLYNPDLVREALAGDPSGEVKGAAAVINLQKVLDSGPAPRVMLKTPNAGSALSTPTVTATAEITDRGKGIGRVEWRVNGITAAVVTPPRNSTSVVTLSQTLSLDPGDNVIEVVAYNANNILASAPARTIVKAKAQAQAAKPRLHVLAVGINAYTDGGWVAPGQSEPSRFGPLSLAVKDAKTFAEEVRRAAGGLYGNVRIEVVADQQATRDNLDRVVTKFAEGIDQRDTFILFVAAHGYSHENKFFLIPSDYDGGPDPAALAARAISQDRLQDWLSNRVRARKAIVLLDTCESGALVAGYRRSRVDAAAAEATVGRLHEATGRPVLAAAAQGQFAHEGVVSGSGDTHGIFTWAMLDALRKGDRNANGTIELSELVAHVQDEVPKLAAKLGGLARSATSAEPVFGQQTSRFGSRGEDFAVVRKLQ